MTSPDRIEKKVFLKAPRQRVWRAITDSTEFGTWFGMRFDAPFRAGTTLHGKIVPTKVDPEVAEMQRPYEDFPVELRIVSIEPERLFSFRWHPFAVEKGAAEKGHDYTNEEMTLVSFHLEEVPGGVELTITETGFDRIPLERRAKAFAANDGGWAKQCELITKYLADGAR